MNLLCWMHHLLKKTTTTKFQSMLTNRKKKKGEIINPEEEKRSPPYLFQNQGVEYSTRNTADFPNGRGTPPTSVKFSPLHRLILLFMPSSLGRGPGQDQSYCQSEQLIPNATLVSTKMTKCIITGMGPFYLSILFM